MSLLTVTKKKREKLEVHEINALVKIYKSYDRYC